MNDQARATSDHKDAFGRRPVVKAALGLVFGAILGLIFGNALGNASLGLIIGAGLGLLIGSAFDRQRKQESSQTEQ
jgi:cell shape-determining protein MreD